MEIISGHRQNYGIFKTAKILWHSLQWVMRSASLPLESRLVYDYLDKWSKASSLKEQSAPVWISGIIYIISLHILNLATLLEKIQEESFRQHKEEKYSCLLPYPLLLCYQAYAWSPLRFFRTAQGPTWYHKVIQSAPCIIEEMHKGALPISWPTNQCNTKSLLNS